MVRIHLSSPFWMKPQALRKRSEVRILSGSQMVSNRIKSGSKVQFYPLLKKDTPDEKGFFVVVRVDTDKTIKVEKDALNAIKSFQHGHTIVKVSRITGRSQKEIAALIEGLTEEGFIKSIDNCSSCKILCIRSKNISHTWPGLVCYYSILVLLVII